MSEINNPDQSIDKIPQKKTPAEIQAEQAEEKELDAELNDPEFIENYEPPTQEGLGVDTEITDDNDDGIQQFLKQLDDDFYEFFESRDQNDDVEPNNKGIEKHDQGEVIVLGDPKLKKVEVEEDPEIVDEDEAELDNLEITFKDADEDSGGDGDAPAVVGSDNPPDADEKQGGNPELAESDGEGGDDPLIVEGDVQGKEVNPPGNSSDGVSKAVEINLQSDAKFKLDGFNIEAIRPDLKTEPNTAFFWSGRTDGIGGQYVAANIAKERGGVTLETTIAEKQIEMPEWDFNNPDSMKAWDMVSDAYASQVSGEVRAVVGANLREGNIWENVELPRLKENPNVDKITIIDPKSQSETIVFERSATQDENHGQQ